MVFIDSLLTSAFGIAVVFAALIVLILLIKLQSSLFAILGQSRKSKKRTTPKTTVAIAKESPVVKVPASPVPGKLQLINVDEKTAAMIMAIVCDESGIAPNELYFKSITAMDEIQAAMGEGV